MRFGVLLRRNDAIYRECAKYLSDSSWFLFQMPDFKIYILCIAESETADVFCLYRDGDDIVGRSGICSIVGGPLDDGNQYYVCGEAYDELVR